ncbi:hypothetical protein DFH06DRAFT_1140563 [Mycena polygramma]|nr:hypothetical protein DFH06DRAFT_1140563 [Mycena polygramma]
MPPWNLIPPLFDLFSAGAPWREPLTAGQEEQLDRDAFAADTQDYEGPFSRLHELPVELVFLIFAFTMPPFTPSSGFLGLREGPWALSAVCRSWRTLVLSQPTFWNSICLDFADDDYEAPSFAELKPKLQLLLARSAQAPLHITFRACFCTDRERRALDLLAQHCERWGSLTFTGPPTLCSRLDTVRNRLPLLRELDARVHQEHTSAPPPRYGMFGACPSLCAASVNSGRCGGGRPFLVDLPYAQLRRYSASNPWAAHAEALRAASSLVDCVLHFPGPATEHIPSASASGGRIVLPQLHRLSVSRTDVLDLLHTPALRELYCAGPSPQLYAFLPRAPLLRKLFVALPPSSPAADIAALLRAAGTIASLDLCLYLPMNLAQALFALLAPLRGVPWIPAASLRRGAPAICVCLAPVAGHPPPDEAALRRTLEGLALPGARLSLAAGTLARGMQIAITQAGAGSELYLDPDWAPREFRLDNDFERPYVDHLHASSLEHLREPALGDLREASLEHLREQKGA